jgi:Mn-dependent DtxR family transcriptional regulator
MHIQESGEMYLETIYLLSAKSKNVRAIDVGEYMGYSKPSVSRAMGLLKDGGYVYTDSEGFLFLTDKGKALAEKTYDRHRFFSDFFVSLGVKKDTADEDACKIEHVVSDETFKAIQKYVADCNKKK